VGATNTRHSLRPRFAEGAKFAASPRAHGVAAYVVDSQIQRNRWSATAAAMGHPASDHC